MPSRPWTLLVDGEPFLSPAAVPAREAAAAARFVSRSLPHRAVALCRLGRNCNRTLRRFARGEEITR